jgi:hypothetical protein
VSAKYARHDDYVQTTHGIKMPLSLSEKAADVACIDYNNNAGFASACFMRHWLLSAQ